VFSLKQIPTTSSKKAPETRTSERRDPEEERRSDEGSLMSSPGRRMLMDRVLMALARGEVLLWRGRDRELEGKGRRRDDGERAEGRSALSVQKKRDTEQTATVGSILTSSERMEYSTHFETSTKSTSMLFSFNSPSPPVVAVVSNSFSRRYLPPSLAIAAWTAHLISGWVNPRTRNFCWVRKRERRSANRSTTRRDRRGRTYPRRGASRIVLR